MYHLDDVGEARALKKTPAANENEELVEPLVRNPPNPATGTDKWKLDVFMLDQSAIPTFVECKRHQDTRARRQVVAQMLDYAANGHHYWTGESIRASLKKVSDEDGRSLNELVSSLQPDDDLGVDDYLDSVQRNLRDGRIRLIFYLDEAPAELKSIVEFLNKQTELTELYVVEARQYELNGQRIVAPRVFGYTEEARAIKVNRRDSDKGKRKIWTEKDYFEAARTSCSPEVVAAIERVYQEVQNYASIKFGSGIATGSFSFRNSLAPSAGPFSLRTNGVLEFKHHWTLVSENVPDLAVAFQEAKVFDADADLTNEIKLAPTEWVSKVGKILGVLAQKYDPT